MRRALQINYSILILSLSRYCFSNKNNLSVLELWVSQFFNVSFSDGFRRGSLVSWYSAVCVSMSQKITFNFPAVCLSALKMRTAYSWEKVIVAIIKLSIKQMPCGSVFEQKLWWHKIELSENCDVGFLCGAPLTADGLTIVLVCFLRPSVGRKLSKWKSNATDVFLIEVQLFCLTFLALPFLPFFCGTVLARIICFAKEKGSRC